MRNTSELRKEAATIEKRLLSGKVKGSKTIKRAKARVAALRYHANRRDKNQLLKSAGAKSRKGFNANQFQLPTFLGQMDLVRIEEIIAENVRKALAGEIKKVAKTASVSSRKASKKKAA